MEDRQHLFETLRTTLLRAAPQMVVSCDEPGRVDLNAPWAHPRKPKEPMWFGAVKLGKSYVSYHLMPLYTAPDLAASIPDALRQRMQGKTCFNFRAIDPNHVKQLEELTSRCAKAYEQPISL